MRQHRTVAASWAAYERRHVDVLADPAHRAATRAAFHAGAATLLDAVLQAGPEPRSLAMLRDLAAELDGLALK